KSRGKGSQGKKTADTHVADVDVFEESNSEPAKKKTATRRTVKKKVIISAADNIIPNLDVALELGKSISLTKAEQVEAAKKVHATHARIVTESFLESVRRRPTGISIRDTPQVLKKVSFDPSKKLKGVQSLTLEEQEAADIMQALKESKTKGSSEGTGRQPGVPDESTVISTTSSKGTEEEKKDDDDDDRSIDLELTDDEVLHGVEQANDDEDEEMTNAEVEDSREGDAETSDVAKANVEKTEDVKDDAKKAEVPLKSSSLSVSSSFGDQFLKISYDTSLIGTVKDTRDAEINSLLDIKIQSSIYLVSIRTQSTRVCNFKPLVLKPVQESPSVKPVTSFAPPSVSIIPHVPLQQTTTPILTPPTTTGAPTITIVVPESDALIAVQLRVAKLENDELPKHTVDLIQKHYVKLTHELTKIQTPIVDLEQESEKSPSKIRKIKKEQAEKQKMPAYTIKSTDKALLKELYHALMEALIEDENLMDKGVVNTVKDHKRKHDDDDDDDDDDEDPPARPNQGKMTKRKRTKEFEPLKKPSTTKEIPKGKAPSKGSKTGKSASAKEPLKEPIAKVVMDDAGKDVVRNDDQPRDTSKLKTDKTLKWFKQPPRPPTLDPEWNRRQKILGVKSVSVKKLHGYGHLEEIVVNRDDRQLCKFKEESYQKKLNITVPQKTFPEIKFIELYTPSYKPPGVIYKDLNKQKRVMRADELYKLSDGTLKKVQEKLHHKVLDFCLRYNNKMERRKWTYIDKKRSKLMIELIEKQMHVR
nr:hypothetical protein [Tanacetum cinerariifolium]